MTATARAIAFHHALHALVCDRVVPWPHGTVVFADEFAESWALNTVRVEGPDPGLDVSALVAAADRLQAGCAHRQIEVEDEAAGRRLRPGFEALGWDAERLVWMELRGPARAEPSTVEISEIPLARTHPLREAWYLDGGWTRSVEETRSFIELEDRLAAKTGTRALAAWGEGGELLGYVTFTARSGAAEIEQAYVKPERRGAGIGGALVAAAVEAAGAPTTFIVANDEEDAKRLYARLGFEPVWRVHQFIRRPPET